MDRADHGREILPVVPSGAVGRGHGWARFLQDSGVTKAERKCCTAQEQVRSWVTCSALSRDAGPGSDGGLHRLLVLSELQTGRLSL